MSKIQLQPYHKGIENVALFEKTRLNILRQSNMMWLESNTNYNYGFNHAWIALQGAAAETAADNVAHKKLISRISQLEAENATLAADLFTLQQAESRNPTSEPVAVEPPAKSRRQRAKGTDNAKITE